jgi:hypothetical protein
MDKEYNAGLSGEQDEIGDIDVPMHVAGSGKLDCLVEAARDYARAAASDNTLKAYETDWAHFARWCRMKGTDPLPPLPEMIGLYLADLASGVTRPLPSLFRLLTVGSRDGCCTALRFAQAQGSRNDKHIARLIKRAGLASSAEVDERYVQKQLGHASAEMTRRYQRRRDRFRVRLTKAAGL